MWFGLTAVSLHFLTAVKSIWCLIVLELAQLRASHVPNKVSSDFWPLQKCFTLALFSSFIPPPALWYLGLCMCARLSATRYVCMLLFFWGTPAGHPNEAQLRFAVQKAEVALQHTHELLKAICGRWHSPLFPQPCRYQQMVAVKTLNIKQPPFIFFFSVSLLSHSQFWVLFCFFCLFFFSFYIEANKEQLMVVNASRDFQSAGFSWTSAVFVLFSFFTGAKIIAVLVLVFCYSLWLVGNSVVVVSDDIISAIIAFISFGIEETRVCWQRIWTARLSEEPNSPPCS